MRRWLNLWETLRSSFWFVPTLMALGAIGLSLLAAEIDVAVGARFVAQLGWIYTGGPAGARSVLSAIAGSVIGVAGTTFSITIAVLSLTSGQFGPRLLRNFMRDPGNQVVLGTFTATFVYSLLVLRTIRGTDETTYVPHVAVTIGVALALFSVAVLIYFVHHVASSIQIAHLIEVVGRDADNAASRLFPEGLGRNRGPASLPEGEPAVVRGKTIGYLESIDEEELLRLARDLAIVVRVEVRPGEYVLPRTKLVSIWPSTHGQDEAFRALFTYGGDRTTLQDVEFAFLQLAEVAVRALSPGINDPFTAMMCLDRIAAAMCLVAEREWPSRFRHDEDGVLRIVAKPLSPAELVTAAFGHIRHAAKSAPAVTEKLEHYLQLLIERSENPALRAALEAESSRIRS